MLGKDTVTGLEELICEHGLMTGGQWALSVPALPELDLKLTYCGY